MVDSAILGTATLSGVALVIVLSVVLYRYYRKLKTNIEMHSMGKRSSRSSLRDSQKSTASWKSEPTVQLPHQEISISKEEPQRPATSRCHPQSLRTPTRHITESLRHVRLSLPEVIVPSFFSTGDNSSTDKASQSSYSLPLLKLRSSSRSRTGSDETNASIDSPPPLSASPRSRSLAPPPDFQLPQQEGAMSSFRDSPQRSPVSPLLACGCNSNSGNTGEAVSPIGALQLDLYQNKGIIFMYAKGRDEIRRCGRLHFRLKYDFDKSDLIVHVIEAHNLVPPSGNKFNDPFVLVRLEPEIDSKNRQTEIRRNSTDPLFDEIFKFPIAYDDMKCSNLVLELYDYDRFSRNEIIGEVLVQLDGIDVTSELEIWSDIIKSTKIVRNPQEILVSLSYLPSAERLTVVVLKAKNLPIPESVRDPDLYVKVMLISNEGKMKKKKTSTKKGSSNPVWNEALTFSVSQEHFQHTQLVVTVIHQDRLGNGHSIGSCVVGINRKDKEYIHWHDVLMNPRKSIAMWHEVTSVNESSQQPKL